MGSVNTGSVREGSGASHCDMVTAVACRGCRSPAPPGPCLVTACWPWARDGRCSPKGLFPCVGSRQVLQGTQRVPFPRCFVLSMWLAVCWLRGVAQVYRTA